MKQSAYKTVLKYLQDSKLAISPSELSRETRRSTVTIHQTLKRLIAQGWVIKHGISPHTYYSAVDPLAPEKRPMIKKPTSKGTTEHFILWCKENGYHVPEIALEYQQILANRGLK